MSNGWKWAQLWFRSCEKIKIEYIFEKTKKIKIIEYDGFSFLYSNSDNFFNIIIIIIIIIILIFILIIIIIIIIIITLSFLLPMAIVFGFLLWRTETY